MSGLSIREIASIGFPLGNGDGWLMMLQAYLDDSGTHTNGSHAVVIGGLIGAEPQWRTFDREWRAALKEPLSGKPPIKKWASADCWARSGEFGGYSIEDKNAAFDRFRAIIAASGVVSIAVAVDRVAWDELVTGGYRTTLTSAEAVCLTGVVDKACKYASTHPVGDKIAIYYDVGRQAPELERIAGLYKSRISYNPQVVSFSFLKVADATPLQGADMCATESYWHVKDYIKFGPGTP
jgi:hypothetical protein